MKSNQLLSFFTILILLSFCGFVSADSLVAHWALDEANGVTVYDSANSYDGTIVGNPIWDTGQVDGCLDFDGSGDYVNFGSMSTVNFSTSNFTISFWFKTEGTHDIGGGQTGSGVLLGKYSVYTGRQWYICQTSDGKIHFVTYHANTSLGGDECKSTESHLEEWTYCTAVRQGTVTYMYINGQLDSSGLCPKIVTSGSSTNVFMGLLGDGRYYFNGKIDDMRVYDYALDANAIDELYQSTLPAPCEPIAHWKLDEGTGTTAYDSANSYNGTIRGTPVWSTEGKIDSCLDFSGSNGYVNFGSMSTADFSTSNFTFSFWFKTEGTHNTGQTNNSGVFLSKYDANRGRQWYICQTASGNIEFVTYHSNTILGGDSLTSTDSYGNNKWVYCTAVRDGTTKYLYVNGVLNTSGSCPSIVSGISTSVYMGVLQDGRYYFNGKLDDVRVYDCALSADQIAAIYGENTATLESIEIVGPNSVAEESTAQYQITGYYSDATTADLTADANFSLSSDEFASIDANGLLTTERLYRVSETCTVNANYDGLAVSMQVTIYAVCDGNGCTTRQIVKRNIDDAIELKTAALEKLERAVKIENASYILSRKLPSTTNNWSKARIQILAAWTYENWAIKKIDDSITLLESADRLTN